MKSKTANQSKRLKEILQLKLKESHATEMLGFALDSVASGRAVLRLDVRRRHVHGGILAAMADTAAAIASYTMLPKGTALATVELSINYLEAVPRGRVKADARVLRVGRNFVVAECEIRTEEGSLAAKALLTFGAAVGHTLRK